MDTIWQYRSYDSEIAQGISRELNLSPIISSLLAQRGITAIEAAENFLHPDLKYLTDPYAMRGVQASVKRIQSAIEKREKIIIYGDYDVDGACSIVLMKECFKQIGYDVDYYVPDRFSEGYGLNKEAVEYLTAQGYKLLITVDCGISSVEETELAQKLGLDVIITDHHNPPAVQPAAQAVINPKNDMIPVIRNLAGVGVSYKLASALMKSFNREIDKKWLDLVALATIADIVPLLDENRILVSCGLRELEKTSRPGLQALMKKTSLSEKDLHAWHVSFVLAPHINSAGRLDSARKSIELLLTTDEKEANSLAEQLCQLNARRRMIEAEIYQQAEKYIYDNIDLNLEPILITGGEDWHEGVIGIVASRLANNFNRPAMVISWSGERGKGSARSIGGFDIYEAFTHCQNLLEHFGGHKLAGGFSISKNNLEPFKAALKELVLTKDQHDPSIKVHLADMELEEAEITPELFAEINHLAPFGEGNPFPCFVLRGSALQDSALIGSKSEHFKSKTGRSLEIIAFNRSDLMKPSLNRCHQDLLFELNENTFRGQTNLQLKIKDMKNSCFPDYLYGKKNNSAKIAQALNRTVCELNEHHPVLFIYPGLRSLNKHLPLLRGLFKTGQILEFHGQTTGQQRQYVQKQFLRGEPRIYLSTQAYVAYYKDKTKKTSGKDQGIFPENLRFAVEFWPEEKSCKTDLEGLNIEVFAIQSSHHILLQTKQWEIKQKSPGIVYANLPSTIQNLTKLTSNLHIEAGVLEPRLRMNARQKFIKASSGLLVIDGTHPESLVQLGSVQEIILADNPFGCYELAAATDYLENEEISVSLSFPFDNLKKNKNYLDRVYPEQQQLEEIWQRLQKYGMTTIRAAESQFAARLAADCGKDFKPMDLLPILYILADLGLCQFEKSGSIIEIKFIQNKNIDLNIINSPYYLEGIAEKALLKNWEARLNNNLVW